MKYSLFALTSFLTILFSLNMAHAGGWLGERCTFDSDCDSGKCHISKRICEDYGGGFPVGWSCTFDSDCTSGQCNITQRKCEDIGGGFPRGWKCSFDSDCSSSDCDILRHRCR